MRLQVIISLFAILVMSSLFVVVSPLSAQGNTPCSASINGVPVDGHTIDVAKDSEATIEVVAPEGPAQNFVYLEFFGKRWEIASPTSDGGEWSETIDVSDYARWGVGLYKVVWESLGEDGGVLCRSSATINVGGFPLATLAGAVGAASLAIGLR